MPTSLFEGPMGLELLVEVRAAMQAESPVTRYKLNKCAKVRTSDKAFDGLHHAVTKHSNTLFIRAFMCTHWVEIKSLSDTDRAQIILIYESTEKERWDNMQSNDEFHDGNRY